MLPVDNTVRMVHHPYDVRLVRGVEWRHGDVSHCSEFTAVVQMLVLKPEEVPDKPPVERTVLKIK